MENTVTISLKEYEMLRKFCDEADIIVFRSHLGGYMMHKKEQALSFVDHEIKVLAMERDEARVERNKSRKAAEGFAMELIEYKAKVKAMSWWERLFSKFPE